MRTDSRRARFQDGGCRGFVRIADADAVHDYRTHAARSTESPGQALVRDGLLIPRVLGSIPSGPTSSFSGTTKANARWCSRLW